VVVPGRAAEAEELWYDPVRWPAWIDGFGHLVSVTDEWPTRGARRLWDAKPGGRGRVSERVAAHEARTGQTLEIEDERVEGTEEVAFVPTGADGVRVTLTRTWERKAGGPLAPVLDVLVERRRTTVSLRATLARFAAEHRADAELRAGRLR
jgi:hypothetical protein